jgi:ABC-2 type transport system ATP-binding protein
LKKEVGGERLEIVAEAKDLKQVAEIVGKVSGGKVSVEEGSRQVSAPVTTGSRALLEAVRSLDDLGIHPLDIALKRPSLDDVFIALTGHVAEEKKSEESNQAGKRGRRK